MSRLTPRLDFDTALGAQAQDARATITLIVASAVLSVRSFQGVDLEFLVVNDRDWPRTLWNLFTTTLLHGGWMHLVFNLYWTFKFGVLLEAMFGTLWFGLILVVLGAGSTAAEFAFGTPCIGLSGIGYGLFGLLWALSRWHPLCRGLLNPQLAQLFAAWFLICIAATWFDIMPVANLAHGGGFALGALLGWTLAAEGGGALRRASAPFAFIVLLAVVYLPGVRSVLNISASGVFQRAYDASAEGRDAEALRLYREFLELRPQSAAGAHNLGLLLARQGRIDEALEAFDRALRITPDDSDTLGAKAELLEELGRHEEALVSLQRATTLDPSNRYRRTLLGWCLWELGRLGEGLAVLEQSLEDDPDNAHTLGAYGWLLLQDERPVEALAALDRSLELEPGSAWIHDRRARVLALLGRYEEALGASERALELAPEDEAARATRASILRAGEGD